MGLIDLDPLPMSQLKMVQSESEDLDEYSRSWFLQVLFTNLLGVYSVSTYI
jgi:hypothetical protein